MKHLIQAHAIRALLAKLALVPIIAGGTLCSTTSLAYDDAGDALGISGYSGLPSVIPRSSRNAYYRYKALSQRVKAEGNIDAQKLNQDVTTGNGVQTFGGLYNDIYFSNDCSINIGNIVDQDNFGRQDNVVVIEGDVINAGRCN